LQRDEHQVQPFWNYYGGKFRAAPRYPAPRFPAVVEPFAGAAGYSLRYPDRAVTLVEKYPVVAEMWRYLIAVSPDEVRRIPEVEHVDELPAWVPPGARALVGFTLTTAAASPRKSLTSGLRKLRMMGRRYGGWYAERRERVACQVERIRHWRVIEGDYTSAPNIEATWFIDPPYQFAGSHYVHKLQPTEYTQLAEWCRARRGQVMVCENVGATWLPFSPFLGSKSGPRTGYSQEALWCVDGMEG
jgi:hypothetical protein